MSGAGNDFVVADIRGQTLDMQMVAIDQCARTGADGLLCVDTSEIADFRLHFYNADGSRGEMCGNGARCVCKFAYDLGIVGPEITIQTDAGIVRGWRLSDTQYRVQLNPPSVVDLHRKGETAYVELGDPGVPHCVTRLPGLTYDQREQLRETAVQLRYDPVFPKGVNVNFYDQVAPGVVRILTYERGVEDYTLSCGTGSASVSVVLKMLGLLPGDTLQAENPGGTLTVTLAEGEIFLEGPAETLRILL